MVKNYSLGKIFLAIVMLIGLQGHVVKAQTTYTFTGATNIFWTTASNWSPSYPGLTINSGDEVIVNNTGSNVELPAGNTIVNNGTITFNSGNTFFCKGNITNNGTLTMNKSVSHTGTITNSGTYTQNGGTFFNESSGTFTNSGAASTLNLNRTFQNKNGSTFSNEGNIQIVSTWFEVLSGSVFTNQTTGIIQGRGNIKQEGTFINNSGSKIIVGSSSTTETLNIVGSMDLAAGTLEINIDADNDFDRLAVTGTFTIGASSILNLSFGYNPALSQAYDIITAATVSGNFDSGNVSEDSPDVTSVNVTNESTATRVTVDGVLPVELLYFEAVKTEKGILLQWETVSELNNKGFEVQRSVGLENWEIMSFINGAGSTFDAQNYQFRDEQPRYGQNYYRLKQIDFDGQFEYSKIISVEFQGEDKVIGTFYPNPSSSGNVTLNYFTQNDGEVAVFVFDLTGKLIINQFKQASSGENNLNFDFSTLQAGVYVVKIENGRNSTHRKLVIR